MSRKLFYLNALLLLAILGAGVELRSRWLDARNREEMMRLGKLQPLRWMAKPPIPGTKPVSALEFALVSSQMLFSRDRNPNVQIDIPPPPPEKKWPPLPRSYGLMLIGEKPRIILGAGPANQKSYVAGEKIGEIQIVEFDNKTIKFAWNDKTVEKRLEELVDNNPMGSSGQPSSQQPPSGGYGGPPPGAAAPAAMKPSGLTTIGGPDASTNPKIGGETGLAGTKSCASGDNSPSGTVLNGMKKVMVQGMFGPSCYWEPAK